MIKLKEALTSSIGKKIINGLTAFGLVAFIIVHLVGNLTLFAGADAFNAYAAKLHSLGVGLYVLEIGLVLVFLFHIGTGISVTLENSSARSSDYRSGQKSKGGPSNFSFASVRMIVSGLILLMFLGIHLLQFRLRPFISDNPDYSHEEYYKHLYTMVDNAFADPVWVATYCLVMVFLGFHLRHGVWSMFQSIGAMNSRWKKSVYGVAFIVGLLLAIGFFVLPLSMYFDWAPIGG